MRTFAPCVLISAGCALTLLACEATEPPRVVIPYYPHPSSDAARPDAAEYDASVGDASALDAGTWCPGGMPFTGDYEDWDSTPMNFDGVEFADVVQVSDPGNAVTTSSSGHVFMCLPAVRTAVDFTQSDYLDLRYTASPGSTQLPVAIRGLRPLRADDLFAQELGMSRDLQTAIVTVTARFYPGGDPVVGATAALGNGHAGAYTADSTGVLGPGDTLIDGPSILFANVEVDSGTTTVQLVVPAGVDCQGPAVIYLVAGAQAAADFVCTSRVVHLRGETDASWTGRVGTPCTPAGRLLTPAVQGPQRDPVHPGTPLYYGRYTRPVVWGSLSPSHRFNRIASDYPP